MSCSIQNPLGSPGSPWLLKAFVVVQNLWYSGESVFPLRNDFAEKFCMWRLFCMLTLVVLLIPSCIYKQTAQQGQHGSILKCIVSMAVFEVLVQRSHIKMNSVLFSLAYIHSVCDIFRSIQQDKTSFVLLPVLKGCLSFLCIAVPLASCLLFNEPVEVGPLSSLLLFIGEFVAAAASVVLIVIVSLSDMYEKAFTF